MRFDMSEYADKEANLEFCGSDKVYKNAKSGNVTGFVSEHPKCILLFDEVEKAHLCVIHLFCRCSMPDDCEIITLTRKFRLKMQLLYLPRMQENNCTRVKATEIFELVS